jgi:hypothetical protein
MKLYTAGILLAQVLLGGGAIAGHVHVDPYALEPSINGGVSASGLFATQAGEDAYHANRWALRLEPCINGDVSANGLFANQAEEDAIGGAMAAN